MGKNRLTREEQKKVTRHKLIKAAGEVFPLYGYNGTSIDVVVETAGYTKGAFYAHFSNKEELFLALIRQQDQLFLDELKNMFAKSAGIDSFLKEYIATIQNPPAETRSWFLLRLEFYLFVLRNESASAELRQYTSQLFQTIKTQFSKDWEKDSGSETLSLDSFVQTFMALDAGFLLFLLLDPKMVPIDDMMSIYRRLVKLG